MARIELTFLRSGAIRRLWIYIPEELQSEDVKKIETRGEQHSQAQ